MSGESLVAPVESTREPWTGSGLADSIDGLADAIRSEGWVDDALAGAALGIEVAATALDPISALLANGLGWAMEYFKPLRQVLDDLTGIPDVVRSHAETWQNMAGELNTMSQDLTAHLANDLPGWTGAAADGYHSLMRNNVDALAGLASTASAMAAATEGAGGLVEMTREIVRDLITERPTGRRTDRIAPAAARPVGPIPVLRLPRRASPPRLTRAAPVDHERIDAATPSAGVTRTIIRRSGRTR